MKGSPVDTVAEDFDGQKHIFITHGHFDHIGSIPLICERNPKATVYCTDTPYKTLIRKGVPSRSLCIIQPDDNIEIGDLKIEALHGKHAVLPKASIRRVTRALFCREVLNLPYIVKENIRCKENDETLMYAVSVAGKRVLIMGSMNLRRDIIYPNNHDLLILPYNGWEDNFQPAISVIEKLKPNTVLLDHFDDTFPPITETVETDAIEELYKGIVKKVVLKEDYIL